MGTLVYLQYTGPEAADIMLAVLAGESITPENVVHEMKAHTQVGFQPNEIAEEEDDEDVTDDQ